MHHAEESKLRILQISTFDERGGAERVAWNLYTSYKELGHHSQLAVGYKNSTDAEIVELNKEERSGPWESFWSGVGKQAERYAGKIRGADRLRRVFEATAKPGKYFDDYRGRENFRYPETWDILNLSPPPDIIHCHNLHGEYFDLRILPTLSHKIPTILTLHDAWLLSGHCSHSFECERWKIGCGLCPDLNIYPAIKRDATAFNWSRKKDLYKNSRFYISTPSKWLMDKVQQSILVNGIIESRIIPNGVDLRVFCSADKSSIRTELGLPTDVKIVLLAAYDPHHFKDSPTLRAAAELMSKAISQDLLFIVLGDRVGTEKIGNAEVRLIQYQREPSEVARYFQAADLYVHVTRADTFPNAILESLACGTPVIANAVGGIPEQIKSLEEVDFSPAVNVSSLGFGVDEATGVVVPSKEPALISQIAVKLLGNSALLLQMSENASRDARLRFGLNKQVEAYLSWYSKIINEKIGKAV